MIFLAWAIWTNLSQPCALIRRRISWQKALELLVGIRKGFLFGERCSLVHCCPTHFMQHQKQTSKVRIANLKTRHSLLPLLPSVSHRRVQRGGRLERVFEFLDCIEETLGTIVKSKGEAQVKTPGWNWRSRVDESTSRVVRGLSSQPFGRMAPVTPPCVERWNVPRQGKTRVGCKVQRAQRAQIKSWFVENSNVSQILPGFRSGIVKLQKEFWHETRTSCQVALGDHRRAACHSDPAFPGNQTWEHQMLDWWHFYGTLCCTLGWTSILLYPIRT